MENRVRIPGKPASESERAAQLRAELDALKRELRKTKWAFKRSVIADEMRNVAAQLADLDEFI